MLDISIPNSTACITSSFEAGVVRGPPPRLGWEVAALRLGEGRRRRLQEVAALRFVEGHRRPLGSAREAVAVLRRALETLLHLGGRQEEGVAGRGGRAREGGGAARRRRAREGGRVGGLFGSARTWLRENEGNSRSTLAWPGGRGRLSWTRL